MPPPSTGLGGAMGERFVVCFIGLPARGKQFMAERLTRYLRFFHGATCQMFDIAQPEYAGDDTHIAASLCAYLEEQDATATTQLRTALDLGALDEESLDRLKKNVDSGKIAVIHTSDPFKTLKSTWCGSSKDKRWSMQKQLAKLSVHVKLLFVELIVNDDKMVRRFLRQKLELTQAREYDDALAAASCWQAQNPGAAEPVERSAEDAEAELEQKLEETEALIHEFHRQFVTLQEDGSEDELSYMKLTNCQKVLTNRVRGFLSMQIVKYLSHIHPQPRVVYLSRHGQSEYNYLKKIGGNPGLTALGERYAQWLGEYFDATMRNTATELPPESALCSPRRRSTAPSFGGAEGEQQRPCRLWTSTMKRTIDTARHIPHPPLKMPDGSTWHQMAPRVYRNLDEIFAGEYEGWTYEQIEETEAKEASLRKHDKLGYRYPRGESYLDLIARLDPLMHELESYTEPLLIVSHQATLRMVYSYLMGRQRESGPKTEIPLHALVKIQWDGWVEYEPSEEWIRPPKSWFESVEGELGDDGQAKL